MTTKLSKQVREFHTAFDIKELPRCWGSHAIRLGWSCGPRCGSSFGGRCYRHRRTFVEVSHERDSRMYLG